MRPLLLGHRGARATRRIPENTLESFELCLQHGCDGFEFDVRLAADGIAVICHDPVFAGQEVARTPASELALPTLGQVLQRFSTRAFLDIELKVANLDQQLIAAMREHPPQKGYVVSSFLPDALHALSITDDRIPLGLLLDEQVGPHSPESDASLICSPEFSAPWIIPHVSLVNQHLIERAHVADRKIAVWTVNQADEMHRLSNWCVDAIISDDTELLVRTLG